MTLEGKQHCYAPFSLIELDFTHCPGLLVWLTDNPGETPHPWGDSAESLAAVSYGLFYERAVAWSEQTGKDLPGYLIDLEDDWAGQWTD